MTVTDCLVLSGHVVSKVTIFISYFKVGLLSIGIIVSLELE